MITVEELIEKLQKLPPKAVVLRHLDHSNCCEIEYCEGPWPPYHEVSGVSQHPRLTHSLIEFHYREKADEEVEAVILD